MTNLIHDQETGAVRESNGRFVAGHKMGRAKRATEIEALAAVNRAMPPAKIEKLLNDACDWCYQHKSVKGAVKLLQLALSYQLGTPVRRVVSARLKVNDILATVGQLSDDEVDTIVNALYEEGTD